MEPEEIKNLTPTPIEKGKWVAFVHEQSKRVVFVAEFKGGGNAKTLLKLLVKNTKEELLAQFKADGLTYVEPKAK
jgi:hypothetical protein